ATPRRRPLPRILMNHPLRERPGAASAGTWQSGRGTFTRWWALNPRNRREEGERMTYDRLVCANCAAPVSEGRCPVCRANRERMRQEHLFAGLNPMALIALLAVLIAALALLAQQTV